MAIGIINSIIHIIVLSFQLTFFYLYDGEVLNNRSIFHYSMAIMVGAEVWAWIGETLWPIWMFNWGGNNTDFQYLENANLTSLPTVLEFIKEFLEPVYVEFATIAIGVLFHLWNTINRQHKSSHSIETDLVQIDSLISNDLHEPGSTETLSNSSAHRKMIISIVISTALALIYVTICELTYLKEQVFSYFGEIVVYRVTYLVYFSMLLIVTFALLLKLRGKKDVNSNHLNSSEYVLLLGTCIDTIYYTLRIVATIGYLDLDTTTETETSIAWLYLIYSVIALFQIWVQTKLLITMRRKRIPQFSKYFLVFISAINFAEWFQGGLQLGLSKQGESKTIKTPIMESFYGETSTRILRLLLYPVIILYRFHSGLIAVELIQER